MSFFRRNIGNKYEVNRTIAALNLEITSTQTPTLSYDFNNNTKTIITASEPSASRTITYKDPGANDSVAYLNSSQTLANKTLISPIINTPILTTPTLSGSLIPSANNTYDIGSSTYNLKNVYISDQLNLTSPGSQIVLRGNTTFNINTSTVQSLTFSNPQGSSDNVTYQETPQTMQNKSFSNTTNFTPTSNQLLFGGNLTLNVDSSAANTVTLPNATDTIVLFVKVCIAASRTIVSVAFGRVIVFAALESTFRVKFPPNNN